MLGLIPRISLGAQSAPKNTRDWTFCCGGKRNDDPYFRHRPTDGRTDDWATDFDNDKGATYGVAFLGMMPKLGQRTSKNVNETDRCNSAHRNHQCSRCGHHISSAGQCTVHFGTAPRIPCRLEFLDQAVSLETNENVTKIT